MCLMSMPPWKKHNSSRTPLKGGPNNTHVHIYLTLSHLKWLVFLFGTSHLNWHVFIALYSIHLTHKIGLHNITFFSEQEMLHFKRDIWSIFKLTKVFCQVGWWSGRSTPILHADLLYGVGQFHQWDGIPYSQGKGRFRHSRFKKNGYASITIAQFG